VSKYFKGQNRAQTYLFPVSPQPDFISKLCAKIALFELFLSHLNQIMKRIMNELKITNRGVNNRMIIRNIIATASF
jgi:hypothetical protein